MALPSTHNKQQLHKFMDVRIAPCNPCSLETIPVPIRLANGQFVWPMIMSCYELTTATSNDDDKLKQQQQQSLPPSDEQLIAASDSKVAGNDAGTIVSSLTYTETSSLTTQEPSSTTASSGSNQARQPVTIHHQNHQNRRVGHMDISFLAVPNVRMALSAMPLQFDPKPITITVPSQDSGGGILDGQWCYMPSYMINHKVHTKNSNQNYCFASAHSTGEVHLHALHVIPNNHDDEQQYVNTNDPNQLVKIEYLGQSSKPTTTTTTGINQSTPLCLSLRWDESTQVTMTTDSSSTVPPPSRIVSTYSNGTVAIHDVTTGASDDYDKKSDSLFKQVQIIEYDRWNAHTMYPTKAPAEVWTAAFVGSNTNETKTNIVWSGGDDCQLKIWDIRSTNRPMLLFHNLFDAGITCISPHPTNNNIVAVGSYDENIILFDTRYISSKQPFWKSGNMGGGIWRMKWHPYTSNRMLVGAMHGGCCVLNFLNTCLSANDEGEYLNNTDNNESYNDSWDVKCTKYFTEHESMVYGADWLVYPHPTQNGYFEAAASCSFYDRAVYIWDSVY